MSDVTNYCNEFFNGISGRLEMNVHNLFLGIAFAIALYLLYRFLFRFIDRKQNKINIDNNIKKIARIIIKIVYIFFSVMIVASLIGLNTSSLIAAFSVLGIAISLSVQQIMTNVANSFSIFINKPFKIGEHIKVNGMEGIIKDINFVNTKILTFDNELIIVPNSIMGNAVIYNYSLNDIRRIILEVGITYKASFELVRTVIINALNNIPSIIKEKNITVAINKFDDSAILYQIRFYTADNKFLETRDKSFEEIIKALNNNNIEIPYPIRVIEIKEK